MIDQSFSQLILTITTIVGAFATALWLGFILWTLRDMRARSRDVLAQGAATLMVAALPGVGFILYLMLRPRETLAEAYERSLEEEALLQGIEEKPACPGCGRPSNAHWQVCPYCHTRLKKPCVKCDQLLEISWNLCPYCATVQGNVEPESRQTPTQKYNQVISQQARARRNEQREESVPSLEFIDEDDL
jgi:hypothetical protein